MDRKNNKPLMTRLFASFRAVCLGVCAIVVISGPVASAQAEEVAMPLELANKLRPAVTGEGALDTPFYNALEEEITIKSLKGRGVVMNFWATWCAPCVREMPGLERLHQTLKDEGFLVMAVSEDRGGAAKVEPFLDRLGLHELPVFLDLKGALARGFAVRGLPATFVIDRNGGVVAGLTGPAEWDSPEAIALIRHYLNQDSRAQGSQQSKDRVSETSG